MLVIYGYKSKWGIVGNLCYNLFYSPLAYNVVPLGDHHYMMVQYNWKKQYIFLCALYKMIWRYHWFFKQLFAPPLKVMEYKQQLCLRLFLIRTLPFTNLVSIMKQALMSSFLCDAVLELVWDLHLNIFFCPLSPLVKRILPFSN